MRSYHASFYIPIILLWGAVASSSLDPVLIQSDIGFEPEIQRYDLLRVDPGGDIAPDELIIFRRGWIDYIARVIGLPGDEIILGIDGSSVIRNGQRVAVSARGLEFAGNESGMLTVGEGQAAIYLDNGWRNPVALPVGRDEIRGPVEKIYRYTNLERSDWFRIGLYSGIVVALVVLPFASVVRRQRLDFPRLIILVSHSFLSIVVTATLVAVSLPDDPLQLGISEPLWWWFPLSVVSGFRLEVVLVVGAFLAIQWLRLNQPWRRDGANAP